MIPARPSRSGCRWCKMHETLAHLFRDIRDDRVAAEGAYFQDAAHRHLVSCLATACTSCGFKSSER